jgi:hypothetical protein
LLPEQVSGSIAQWLPVAALQSSELPAGPGGSKSSPSASLTSGRSWQLFASGVHADPSAHGVLSLHLAPLAQVPVWQNPALY